MSLSPARRDIPVLSVEEARGLSPHGPLTVAARTKLIIEAVTAKYGNISDGNGVGPVEAARMERQARAIWTCQLAATLSGIPTSIPIEQGGLHAALFARFVDGDSIVQKLVVVSHRGEFSAMTERAPLLWRARLDGETGERGCSSANVHRLTEQLYPLYSDPACALHWDRVMKPHFIRDPSLVSVVNAVTPSLTRLDDFNFHQFPPGGGGKFDITGSGVSCLEVRGPNGRLRYLGRARAHWVLCQMVGAIRRSAFRAQGAWLRRMADPEALRVARRAVASPATRTYHWFLAVESTNPDLQNQVSRYRLQFGLQYPEIIRADWFPATSQACDERVELESRIDQGLPVAELLQRRLGRPRWLDKHLRGRLTSHRGGGIYARVNTRHAMCMLSELGPAWAPRTGDDKFMILISEICGWGLVPFSALAASVPRPGSGPSPWRQLKRSMVQAGDPSKIELKDFLKGCDEAVEILTLVCEWLGGKRVIDRPDTSPGKLAMDLTGAKSLVQLCRLSTAWHGEVSGIIAAFGQLGQGTSRTRSFSPTWPALFAPLVRFGIQLECITNSRALEEHGLQMAHCCGSYAHRCSAGSSHIVAVRRGLKEVATAEIVSERSTHDKGPSTWRCVQLRGRSNAGVEEVVSRAVVALVRGLNSGRVAAFPKPSLAIAHETSSIAESSAAHEPVSIPVKDVRLHGLRDGWRADWRSMTWTTPEAAAHYIDAIAFLLPEKERREYRSLVSIEQKLEFAGRIGARLKYRSDVRGDRYDYYDEYD